MPATTIVLLVLGCGTASAQDAVPPPEIGVGSSGLLVNRTGGDYTVGGTRPALDVRVTVPYTLRFAFEALAIVSNSTSDTLLHKTDAVYVLEIKQRLLRTSGARFQAFLTYGGAGYYAHFHQEPFTITRPNGTSSTLTEFTYDEKDPPFFAVFGGGGERNFGPRTALRVDVQAVTMAWVAFGMRASVGLSLHIDD